MLVTSNDVIHSMAIPSLAIKIDAIPGRLNSVGFIINRPSTFFGQCSEYTAHKYYFLLVATLRIVDPT